MSAKPAARPMETALNDLADSLTRVQAKMEEALAEQRRVTERVVRVLQCVHELMASEPPKVQTLRLEPPPGVVVPIRRAKPGAAS